MFCRGNHFFWRQVNWIKIGDADKGGKYIYKTKEKICPEGAINFKTKF